MVCPTVRRCLLVLVVYLLLTGLSCFLDFLLDDLSALEALALCFLPRSLDFEGTFSIVYEENTFTAVCVRVTVFMFTHVLEICRLDPRVLT